MHERKSNEKVTRGVFVILNSATWFSLETVTNEYNRMYPPSWIKKTIGLKVDKREIEQVLRLLIADGYAQSELFSFTDVTHDPPLVRYRLTQGGIQYFASLKH